ncbi:hypothetical protein ACT29H_03510 [Thermophagus sp. OGC60D27]|uniref:hypothetical protein n=1 Tax=Thermophagus sp. OGC60D27 TaxID=3458415 RepID=UPI00403799D1
MNIKGLGTFLFLASCFLFVRCQGDDIHVETDNEDNRKLEIAAPLGEITYKVSDFLEEIDNEYVFVDEDGLVNARFSQDIDIEWESLITLSDFSETWVYSPLSLSLSPGLKVAASGQFKEKVRLNNRDDIRLDTIYMNGGHLQIQLEVPNGTSGDISVIIPEILNNGQALQYTFPVNGSSHSFTIDEDLAGMRTIPSQAQDSSYLSIVTTVNLDNAELGNVVLDFSLTDMHPGLTFGYFGQQEATKTEQDLSFEVFDDLEDVEKIKFYDLKIEMEVESGIGVPFDVRVQDIQFFKNEGNPCGTLLVGENNETVVNLFMEPATYGNPIVNSITTLTLDRDTSGNMVDIVNCYPERVHFDVTSFSNPEGETALANFMGPDNTLKGTLKIILPAWFKTDEYSRLDTINFDIHDILGEDEDDAREIDEVTIFFDFYSRIPVDITAGAWVIDDQGNKINDLLDVTNVIIAGEPDGQTGYVTEPELSTFSVSLSGDQIDEYLDRNAMEIVLESHFDTPENDTPEKNYIRIYEDMDFRGVVSFKINGGIPSF